jgi:hypothetical protein
MTTNCTFNVLIKQIYDFREYIIFNRIDLDAKTVQHMAIISSQLDLLLKSFKSNETDIPLFIKENQGDLFLIHNTLMGLFKKLYFSNCIHAKTRPIHDRLFNALHIKSPFKRFVYLPTTLCTMFCQGVTYFKTDKLSKDSLFYRDESCADKHIIAYAKFASDLYLTLEEKKTYVASCYIERLIFDAIYTNTLNTKDASHIRELQIMARLFEEYFHGETIDVKITFVNTIYPIKLRVIRTLVNGSNITEIFTKSAWNNDRVMCTKHDENNNKFEKIQTFAQEEKWIQV